MPLNYNTRLDPLYATHEGADMHKLFLGMMRCR